MAFTGDQDIAAASAAMSAMAAQQQARAQQQQAAFQAAVARNNQTLSGQQADDAIDRGEIRVDERRLRTRQLIGQQRSILAASGFDANTEDPIGLIADTAAIGELDALTERSNAEREAFRFRIAGSNAGAQAALFQAKADSISPGFAFANAAIQGGARVANRWYTLKGTS